MLLILNLNWINYFKFVCKKLKWNNIFKVKNVCCLMIVDLFKLDEIVIKMIILDRYYKKIKKN